MVLAYYRLGKFEDARRSMRQLLTFADRFRMDNPLTKCGSDVYQPNQPINLCYDTFGPAAALMRGLFEYLYRAEGLTLVPHVPPGITELEQRDPVRFGNKRILLSTVGTGPITAVRVNGHKWKQFDRATVFLPFAKTPDEARVQILLGGAKVPGGQASSRAQESSGTLASQASRGGSPSQLAALEKRAERLREFERRLAAAGLGDGYEAAHARLASDCIEVAGRRLQLIKDGKIKPLAAASEAAADGCYADTATKLCNGLETVLKSYEHADDQSKSKVHDAWVKAAQ
jgi:hypothetical protein